MAAESAASRCRLPAVAVSRHRHGSHAAAGGGGPVSPRSPLRFSAGPPVRLEHPRCCLRSAGRGPAAAARPGCAGQCLAGAGLEPGGLRRGLRPGRVRLRRIRPAFPCVHRQVACGRTPAGGRTAGCRFRLRRHPPGPGSGLVSLPATVCAGHRHGFRADAGHGAGRHRPGRTAGGGLAGAPPCGCRGRGLAGAAGGSDGGGRLPAAGPCRLSA